MLSTKPHSSNEYPSDDNRGQLIASTQTTLVSYDTILTPGSSFGSFSGSKDTVVFRVKLSLITISKDTEDPNNLKLIEVLDYSKGSNDELDF